MQMAALLPDRGNVEQGFFFDDVEAPRHPVLRRSCAVKTARAPRFPNRRPGESKR